MLRKYSTDAGQAFFRSKLPSTSTNTAPQVYKTNKDIRNHPYVASLLSPQPVPVTKYVSPLKHALYTKNVETFGKFVNNELIDHEGWNYKLKLSKEEIRSLEPSVYLQSYRIKGSWKKTFVFLRMFRRMRLYDAINQCHFQHRAMAFDLADMFERGKQDAIKMGLDPNTLVVEQIWVGKDGDDRRLMDFKGRGRSGMIHSHFVHVKAILKPESILKERALVKKRRLDNRLWFPLMSRKVPEEYVQSANYKW
ncbi:mitochondrial 54S ribosomal protein YmL22 [Starmerella bacillaris]|uniref:Mitochondrial 54S ribosomal protein YmL22 n=1 Tax=Starmerella bacillaris TaxID=1247836 RepID=A0AAV5RNC8_STABA|nr:mitochondrial 54S ribosomal protein YmL22 [Starmerella bacillaris]